jgi:predicted N-acyltransferase
MKSYLLKDNITNEEVNRLKDNSMEIQYEKVFKWCLPRFGDDDESLSEFQAARMRNYMRKRIVEDGWTPKYYTGNRVITAEHVTSFYGACLAKMFMGN